MATVMAQAARRERFADERRFYVAMAGTAVVIALSGFTWRYFLPLSAGTLRVPNLVHVHGLLMWSWTLLFFAQAVLAARGSLRRHRLFGMAGIAVLTLCAWTGATVAIQQLDRQLAAGAGDVARAFFVQPVSLAVLMPVLFGAAIVQARNTDAHARLMLMVTLVALQPALARLAGAAFGTGSPLNGTLGGLGVLRLVGVAMLHDVRSRGRVHAAYVYGGALIFLVQVLRLAIARTDAWYAFADVARRIVH